MLALDEKRRVDLSVALGAAELHLLPWELATFKGGKVLGTSKGCLLRYAWSDRKTRALAAESRTRQGRILFAWSRVPATLHAAHLGHIEQAAKAGDLRFDPNEDVLADVSVATLSARLAKAQEDERPYSVLHVLCHGIKLEGGSAYALAWGTPEQDPPEIVDGKVLGKHLGEYADTLRLVVLCACQGGAGGKPGSRIGGVAQGVHYEGIEAVVASRFPLSTKGSEDFAKVFYEHLLVTPTSVEEAFLAAREKLGVRLHEKDDVALQLYARAEDGFDTRPIVFSPYRGLEPFEQKHARFFHGRTGKDARGKNREVDELLQEFRALIAAPGRPRFMVVAGSSGTGKSSMVLASAVPTLVHEDRWIAQVFRPGETPDTALDEALAAPLPGEGQKRRLLVVDQFEELFTSTETPAIRSAFARRLWDLSRADDGTGVIITVRMDFLGRFEELVLDPEKGDNLDKHAYDTAHQVMVAQMDGDQLREAIEEPARQVGLVFGEGLVDAILKDAGQEPGVLPLVQHTLRLLWEGRAGRTLTQDAFNVLGGVTGALNHHADTVLTALVARDPAMERVARRLLVSLVHVAHGDAPNTRKRVALAALPRSAADAERFDAVLREFVAQRLLVVAEPVEGKGEATVEVAHEALIRKWTKLEGVDHRRSGHARADR